MKGAISGVVGIFTIVESVYLSREVSKSICLDY